MGKIPIIIIVAFTILAFFIFGTDFMKPVFALDEKGFRVIDSDKNEVIEESPNFISKNEAGEEIIFTLRKNTKINISPVSTGDKVIVSWHKEGEPETTAAASEFILNHSESNKDIIIESILIEDKNMIDKEKIRIVFDDKAPAINSIQNSTGDSGWSNSKITVSGTFSDSSHPYGNSGVSRIVWSKGKELGNAEVLVEEINMINIENTTEFYLESDDSEQDTKYYIYAVDKSDNVSLPAISDIKIDKKNPGISLEKKDSRYYDENGLALYPEDVDISVTASDEDSGINEIEWQVVSPYDTGNNQTGRIYAQNKKTYSSIIHAINNSNTIEVNVKITDGAGNISEDTITFSVDKTAPTIQVIYDNNNSDSQFGNFFKANRKASVIINERNFNPENIQYKITNSEGESPKLSEWTTSSDPKNPDNTSHMATVEYTIDGDYTFNISCSDNSANESFFTSESFTIDKTLPGVTITYDNNKANNANYYNSSRTAYITVTEHNFDKSRVKITGSAVNNGEPFKFPVMSEWCHEGDVHTAAIKYDVDAKYSFDIDVTDKTGNPSCAYQTEEFYIDKTAPAIDITGVSDNSSNNTSVIPKISFSDTNYTSKDVKISLIGAKRGDLNLDGVFSDIANGQIFVFNNFGNTKENDDIYTLTASLTDMAGNVSTEQIHFSVNRFGSSYILSKNLNEINNKFIPTEEDVMLSEINVDSLRNGSVRIRITKDGIPYNLIENEDYSIIKAGGDGKWSIYQYKLKKELFTGDGIYNIALYSVDDAGNINENIDARKKAEISFGVDKTKPIIIPVNIEGGKQYKVNNKNAIFLVKDNLNLKAVKIFLNGKEVKPKIEGENYSINICSMNSRQSIEVTAVDKAGNSAGIKVNDFIISTENLTKRPHAYLLFVTIICGSILVIFIKKLRIKKKYLDTIN